jgi:pre-mRNA-splicing factor SYF1
MVNTGIRFAKLERKLGEIDRARAIYAHISQFSNPEGTTFNSQINKRIKKDDDY